MGLQGRYFARIKVGRLLFFKALLFLFCLSFITASFSASKDSVYPESNSISGFSIQADSSGHYRGTVLINNVPMPFLIDTGATSIVVPTSMAYSARLPLGKAVQASTANGFASNRLTRINSLKIGNIEIKNLDALATIRLDEVLIGMTYLKLFHMTQDRNVLTLTLSSDLAASTENIPSVPVLSPQSNIKDQLTRQNSGKAYFLARDQVADFKAQYKKPSECYDMQNNSTRIFCANAFIKARKAYEALNK